MLLGALTASGLSYFVEDRATRDEKVLSLAGAPPAKPALGVRRTILGAWVVGSGLPFAWIALVPQFRHPAADVSISALTTAAAVIGLVSGATAAYLTARSIADPVERVRAAMTAVADGDLSVTVPVDNADELGLLQAGFNHMVGAVAERQHLHDLFGRHVGTEVAQQALERGVELGGETRDVSVLFVDIIGSSELTTKLGPRETVGYLNRFFAVVVSAAAAEGGWVNKFQGDGALCVFGAPAEQPDHAVRALRASCAVHAQLADVDAAVGISTGAVVAGNVGSDTRSEYTVVGTPVIEAARLVEHAKRLPGRVLAAASTISAANGAAHGWQPVGELELRGLGIVEAWSVGDNVRLSAPHDELDQ
jgi:adenylate cyclase